MGGFVVDPKIPIALLLVALILFGCSGQSQQGSQTPQNSSDTTAFSEKLEATNDNLGTSLRNIHEDFYSYDNKYGSSVILNTDIITEITTTNMKSKEDSIKQSKSEADSSISDYTLLKNKADLTMLTPEQNSLVAEIEAKKSDYSSNSAKLQTCLDGMEKYRGLLGLLIQYNSLTTNLSNQMNTFSLQLTAEDYDGASRTIKELTNIFKGAIELDRKVNQTGIITHSEDYFLATDRMLTAFYAYDEAIQLLKAGDNETANDKAMNATLEISSASEITNREENTQVKLNKMETWYSENIGICADIFKKYS